MSTPMLESHMGDDALVRYIDDAAEPDEREVVQLHLAACSGCTGRLEVLRRRSAGLSALLAAASPAVPEFVPRDPALLLPARARSRWAMQTRLPGSPWLRAAAIAALVVGVSLTASPVRAWVTDWLRAGREWVAQALDTPRKPERMEPAAPPPAAMEPTRVRFAPTGAQLRIEITPGTASGMLLFGKHAAAEVQIDALNGEDILVLPDRVRISHAGKGPAEHRVLLPPSVRRVIVVSPGGPPVEVTAEEIGSVPREVRFGPGS